MACHYFDILQAVGAEVRSVNSVSEVSVRRRPLQLDVVDPVPHVIIWPGEGAETVDSIQWGPPGGPAHVTYLYPVLVVLITAGNRVVETGFEEYMQLRQDVRNAIFHPLLGGAATVWDTDIVPQDVFDKLAFTKGNFDVCGWQLYIKSAEFFRTGA